MTANINNQKVTATVSAEGEITLKFGKQSITVPREAATSLVTATLAARKASYEEAREIRQAAKAEAKEARDAKKAAKREAQAVKREAQAAKLRERLAKLETAAATA